MELIWQQESKTVEPRASKNSVGPYIPIINS